MLFKETVGQPALELLKSLMKDKAFDGFFLVGGTALSLQLGHRISIDLDLFTKEPFDQDKLADHLRLKYSFILDFISDNTIKGEAGSIQLDCISHRYPLLEEIKETEGVRLASLIDIAAMKLNAISGSGTRLKDFIDIAFLSERFSLNNMLQAYEKKYHSNKLMPLKAVVYFDDINFEQPIILAGDRSFDWKSIENRLQEMHRNPDKVLGKL